MEKVGCMTENNNNNKTDQSDGQCSHDSILQFHQFTSQRAAQILIGSYQSLTRNLIVRHE